MKIYHTETQEDYDALMVELERRGIGTLEKRYWKDHDNQTVVFVRAIGRYGNSTRIDTTYGSLGWALQNYPSLPITKYKAKAEEKMKFTKENVEKVIDDYFWEADFEPCGDLIAEIHNLDDTPEKVVVPKFVADVFSSELHFEYEIQESRNIPHVLSATFSEVSSNKNIKFLQWVKQHPDKYVTAVKYGYTIEPEKLYCIPLPHLETADGTKQYLTKSGAGNYFALSPCVGQKQRYTKEELERVPEVYKPYAKPIEEWEE